MWIARQIARRRGGEDADVVVRAGGDAVEAEGAVEVAALLGLEEVELAAALRALPRMQSCVVQVRQMARRRAPTLSGEASERTKWNWPIGQTYLQKLAPRNSPSTANAAAK